MFSQISLVGIESEYVPDLWVPVMALCQLIQAECCIYASSNLTIIASDNGLSPVRRQAIVWTNAGILLIGS